MAGHSGVVGKDATRKKGPCASGGTDCYDTLLRFPQLATRRRELMHITSQIDLCLPISNRPLSLAQASHILPSYPTPTSPHPSSINSLSPHRLLPAVYSFALPRRCDLYSYLTIYSELPAFRPFHSIFTNLECRVNPRTWLAPSAQSAPLLVSPPLFSSPSPLPQTIGLTLIFRDRQTQQVSVPQKQTQNSVRTSSTI